MAGDPKQSQTLQQINEAFQTAQSQMVQLRKAVERHSQLARAKSQSDFLQKEKDRALRELGEAVWRQVQKGRLELPAALAPAVKAVQQTEHKAEAQAGEINDLLLEGEETAQRMREKNAELLHSGVAKPGGKL